MNQLVDQRGNFVFRMQLHRERKMESSSNKGEKKWKQNKNK